MNMCLSKKIKHMAAKCFDIPLPMSVDHPRCDPFIAAVDDFSTVYDEVLSNLRDERIFDKDICRIDGGFVATLSESSDNAAFE